jgi:hypothetical protein
LAASENAACPVAADRAVGDGQRALIEIEDAAARSA